MCIVGIAIITTHGNRACETLFFDIGRFELLPDDRYALKEPARQGRYCYKKYSPGYWFEKKILKISGITMEFR